MLQQLLVDVVLGGISDPRNPPRSRALLPVIEESYRLAICLVGEQQAAIDVCTRALGGLSAREETGISLRARPGLLRRLLGEAALFEMRRGQGTPHAHCLPEFGLLPLDEREVLALRLVCQSSDLESAGVLRLSVDEVRALRRRARARVLAAHGTICPPCG